MAEEREKAFVKDPLIELLAIKLYESDNYYALANYDAQSSWLILCEEDRQIYRDIASGKEPLDCFEWRDHPRRKKEAV